MLFFAKDRFEINQVTYLLNHLNREDIDYNPYYHHPIDIEKYIKTPKFGVYLHMAP